MLKKFYHGINTKILITMLILFAFICIAVSVLTLLNLRGIYEKNYTERVLIANNLIATLIDGDDIKYYVELMRDQDEEFKRRQYRFELDREELLRLQKNGASEEECAAVIARMEAFHHDMDIFKSNKYWDTVGDLRKLKEASGAKYV